MMIGPFSSSGLVVPTGNLVLMFIAGKNTKTLDSNEYVEIQKKQDEYKKELFKQIEEDIKQNMDLNTIFLEDFAF